MIENTTASEAVSPGPTAPAPMIMIVEDDPDISRALQLRLEMHGFQTCQSFDAHGSLDVAKENVPALVLLDVTLPGGCGLDVAKSLRQEFSTKDVPIVFMTGSLEPDLPEAAELAGGSAFLEKPIDATKLMETIRALVPEAAELN